MSATNVQAVETTLEKLRNAGKIEDIDSALVAFVLSTAHNFDSAEPGTTAAASCARAHALALDRLRLLSAHDDDAISKLLDSLSNAPVGDATQP